MIFSIYCNANDWKDETLRMKHQRLKCLNVKTCMTAQLNILLCVCQIVSYEELNAFL